MFKPVRVVATIVFLISIGMVFVGAFVIRQGVSLPHFSCKIVLTLVSAPLLEYAFSLGIVLTC